MDLNLKYSSLFSLQNGNRVERMSFINHIGLFFQ